MEDESPDVPPRPSLVQFHERVVASGGKTVIFPAERRKGGSNALLRALLLTRSQRCNESDLKIQEAVVNTESWKQLFHLLQPPRKT